MNKENRMKAVLYNAISLLIDETFEQYDDREEWIAMLYNELGCTENEMKSFGIRITLDGGLTTITDDFLEDLAMEQREQM